MISSLALQQKFIALLQTTTSLFETQEQHVDKERAVIQAIHDGAIDMAREALTPVFERFLAYLLAVNAIEADYPLQAIRFLSLVARSTAIAAVPAGQSSDLATAAFFADLGFRPSWLGQKGTHSELTGYHLRNMGFHWFSPALHSLIDHHHDADADSSPFKCLSLWSRYLELVYGMGSDNPPGANVLPSQALETLVEERPQASAGIKIILKTISAFPLGSWVQLSSGTPALVIGANPLNPLRPRVGYATPGRQGAWAWQEHALQQEPSLHALKEIHPSPAQSGFVNRPQLWIQGWQGEPIAAGEDWAAIFRQAAEDPANPATTPGGSVERVWSGQAPAPRPPAPGTDHVVPSSEGADAELKKLRSDWESHVKLMEESVLKLRGGLVESYRRENDHFREILGALAKVHPITPEPPAVSAAPDTPPEAPSELYDDELRPAESDVAAFEQWMRDEEREIRQMLRDALAKLDSFGSRNAEGRSAEQQKTLTEKLRRWAAELKTIESALLPPVTTPSAAFLELKSKSAAARGYLNGLHALPKNPANASEAESRKQEWLSRYRSDLLNARAQWEADHAVQMTRMEKLKGLVRLHLEEADAVAGESNGL
ncbi:MAG TPA: hypothetical protein VMU17_04100 [Elusimicrobiota bacterium]|nr:hypothetical protein [Elusimicrobiota bacterium]